MDVERLDDLTLLDNLVSFVVGIGDYRIDFF